MTVQKKCPHLKIDHLLKLGEKHDIARCEECKLIFFDGIASQNLTRLLS